MAMREDANIWVAKRTDARIAVVGLPRSTAAGGQTLGVSRDCVAWPVPFTVKDKRYPVQHVTFSLFFHLSKLSAIVGDSVRQGKPLHAQARLVERAGHICSGRFTSMA
jgi:hypothetical protein